MIPVIYLLAPYVVYSFRLLGSQLLNEMTMLFMCSEKKPVSTVEIDFKKRVFFTRIPFIRLMSTGGIKVPSQDLMMYIFCD